jgi:hypothetical protein
MQVAHTDSDFLTPLDAAPFPETPSAWSRAGALECGDACDERGMSQAFANVSAHCAIAGSVGNAPGPGAGGDTWPCLLTLSDVLSLGSLLLPRPTASGTRDGAMPPEGVDGRSQLIARLGSDVAQQRGLVPRDYTTAELTALGEQVVLDHVVHGEEGGTQLLIGLARMAGRLDADALARGDYEKVASQVSDYALSEFKGEFAVHHALGELAQLHMPSRRGVARELLRAAKVDPDRWVDTIPVLDPDNPLAQSEPQTAVDYYFGRDRLSDADIRAMSGGVLSPRDVRGVLARLPASLDAEFGKRFDAYAGDMSAAMARVFNAGLASVGRKYGLDLANAAVTIARPGFHYYATEVAVLRGSAFLYDGKTRVELRGQGYMVGIDCAGTKQRFFFCTRTGAMRALGADVPVDAWIRQHRADVFGEAAITKLDARKDLPHSRVEMARLGEGSHAGLGTWATAVFRAEIEAARETARGQTPAEASLDTLLNFVPFRAMVVAIRKGDVERAVVAGGLDVLSLIPLAGAGMRVGSAATRGGIPLMRLAAVQARASISPLRTLAARMTGLRASIRASLSRTGAQAWGRIRPLDAQRVVAALRSTHPRLAHALEKASVRARGTPIREGWWQVRDPQRLATAADDAIGAAQPMQARGKLGGELSVLPYGDGAVAYTRYDAAGATRTGAILLPDSAGWLYPSLTLEVLERCRVSTPAVLQALAGRQPGAAGTIALSGKDYARVGNDYVEVAQDRAVSVAGRPLWRVVAPSGVASDGVVHRLAYDVDKALWRLAEPPLLNGGGGNCSLHRASVGAQDRNALEAAVDTNFHTELLRHIQGYGSEGQFARLKALLVKAQADPRGAAILRGMRAQYDILGRIPEIVFRNGPDWTQPRPVLEHPVAGKTWHVDLDVLDRAPVDTLVWELAAVYNNMTGVLHGYDPFADVLSGPAPRFAAALEKAWQAWVAEGSSQGVHQGVKRRRVIDTVKFQLHETICYGGMSRVSFQALLRGRPCAPGVGMDLSHSDLVSVPPLPEDVRRLNVAYNGITDWRRLPKGLVALDISGNALTEMPPGLPDGLLELKVSSNYLERLPAQLPAKLRELTLARNRFTEIADVLPQGLVSLRLDENRSLARLPPLPGTLKHLDVSFTDLEELPAMLPPGLETLQAARCRLRRLPDTLPGSLRMLGVLGNALTALPDSINGLVSCRIELSENPIPPDSVPHPPPGQPGPRIFFAQRDGPRAASQRVIEAVERWFNGQEAEAAARWNVIGQAVEADTQTRAAAEAFRGFLDRLRGVERVEALRPEVVEWLVELSRPERQALRIATFGAAIGPTEMCQGRLDWCADRVGWTMNQLRGLRLNDDIERGLYDHQPQAVVEAARQMFRLDVLNEIARQKVKQIGREDEALEIYMAYAVKLRDALNLTTVTSGMRYYGITGIKDHDLADALRTVQSRERAEFEQFLAVSYEPWRALLKRRMGERYDSAVIKMHDLVEQRLEGAIQAEIAALGLGTDDTAALEDARKDVGPRLTQDIQYSVLGPLTREFLASIGSTHADAGTGVAKGSSSA